MASKDEILPLRSALGVNIWHWTQLQKGNVFMQAPDSRMLNGDGFPVWKKVKVKDASTYALPEKAHILYDHSYVVGKIQSSVTDALRDLPIEQLIELLTEAYERTQQGLHARDWELPVLPPLDEENAA